MTEPDAPGRTTTRRAYLALGSNLGDPAARLQRAVDLLAAEPRVRVAGVSRVYETRPVGPAQPDYLNAVVALDTDLDPRALLALAHRLEADAQRVRSERWGPRTLDVDVLLVGDERVDDADLVVPHPRMWQRGFVLAPLADLAPDLVEERQRARGWAGVHPSAVRLSLHADR
jgi:2-amino-4-hydroxy-6-hydroxymethyldihydropteridine diphosphokinase